MADLSLLSAAERLRRFSDNHKTIRELPCSNRFNPVSIVKAMANVLASISLPVEKKILGSHLYALADLQYVLSDLGVMESDDLRTAIVSFSRMLKEYAEELKGFPRVLTQEQQVLYRSQKHREEMAKIEEVLKREKEREKKAKYRAACRSAETRLIGEGEGPAKRIKEEMEISTEIKDEIMENEEEEVEMIQPSASSNIRKSGRTKWRPLGLDVLPVERVTVSVNSPIIEERAASRNCEKCGKNFSSAHALERHMAVHSEEAKPYPCSRCFYRFKTATRLEKHEKEHDRPKENGIDHLTCRLCGAQYSTRKHVLQHLWTVHDVDETLKRTRRWTARTATIREDGEELEQDGEQEAEGSFEDENEAGNVDTSYGGTLIAPADWTPSVMTGEANEEVKEEPA